MEDYEDIVYDGLAFTVEFDEDAPCEVFAASNGDTWTDSLPKHIVSLIFFAAAEKRNARIAESKTDAAISKFESLQDET